MATIEFQQNSPRGLAVIDSKHILVDTDGKAWLLSGERRALTPLIGEQLDAVRNRFGAVWTDAVDGMASIED